jgi:hypothetical protein
MRYEWRRIGIVTLAGGVSVAAARLLAADSVSPLAGLLLRGMVVLVVYPVLLLALGFFRSGERERLRVLAGRVTSRHARTAGPGRAEHDEALPVASALDTAVAGGSALSSEDER